MAETRLGSRCLTAATAAATTQPRPPPFIGKTSTNKVIKRRHAQYRFTNLLKRKVQLKYRNEIYRIII